MKPKVCRYKNRTTVIYQKPLRVYRNGQYETSISLTQAPKLVNTLWGKVLTSCLLSAFSLMVLSLMTERFAESLWKPVKAQVVDRVVLVKDETRPYALSLAARCETNDRHFDGKWKVIVNKKTNDVGRYQISIPHHKKEMNKLGLDPYNEKDNESYAIMLFEREGLQPWSASIDTKTLKCK